MSRNRTLGALAMIFVAGVLVPVGGHAQTADPAGAQKLEQQAESFDVGQFARAADQLVKAAALRSDTDPLGVSDLFRAAGGYYTAGKRARAREMYVQAAERALGMGDVRHAAAGYLAAAIIANEQRDPERDALIAKANRLSASPVLSEGERQAILGQFRQPVQVATH